MSSIQTNVCFSRGCQDPSEDMLTTAVNRNGQMFAAHYWKTHLQTTATLLRFFGNVYLVYCSRDFKEKVSAVENQTKIDLWLLALVLQEP